MALITLLTDFGLQDEYVGVMKGVIAAISPHTPVIDITHGIDPQDVTQGAYILAAAYPYFPAGTIHVAVVDPGVGTHRRMVAMACGGHRFVAPDNGILGRIAATGQAPVSAVYIENRDCFLKTVSHTFHGRDIFAPVAARLATGFPLEELGPAVHSDLLVKEKGLLRTFSDDGEIIGKVIAVDRFGNLLTSIGKDDLFEKGCDESRCPDFRITLGSHVIQGLSTSYASVSRHFALAIMGSRGLLEISVNSGDAQTQLGAKKGDTIRIRRCPPGSPLPPHSNRLK